MDHLKQDTSLWSTADDRSLCEAYLNLGAYNHEIRQIIRSEFQQRDLGNSDTYCTLRYNQILAKKTRMAKRFPLLYSLQFRLSLTITIILICIIFLIAYFRYAPHGDGPMQGLDIICMAAASAIIIVISSFVGIRIINKLTTNDRTIIVRYIIRPTLWLCLVICLIFMLFIGIVLL